MGLRDVVRYRIVREAEAQAGTEVDVENPARKVERGLTTTRRRWW